MMAMLTAKEYTHSPAGSENRQAKVALFSPQTSLYLGHHCQKVLCALGPTPSTPVNILDIPSQTHLRAFLLVDSRASQVNSQDNYHSVDANNVCTNVHVSLNI